MNWFQKWRDKQRRIAEDRAEEQRLAQVEREKEEAKAKQAKEEEDEKKNEELRQSIKDAVGKLENANWTCIDKWNAERHRGEPWGTFYALDPGNKCYKVFCKHNGYYSMTPLAPVPENEAKP